MAIIIIMKSNEIGECDFIWIISSFSQVNFSMKCFRLFLLKFLYQNSLFNFSMNDRSQFKLNVRFCFTSSFIEFTQHQKLLTPDFDDFGCYTDIKSRIVWWLTVIIILLWLFRRSPLFFISFRFFYFLWAHTQYTCRGRRWTGNLVEWIIFPYFFFLLFLFLAKFCSFYWVWKISRFLSHNRSGGRWWPGEQFTCLQNALAWRQNWKRICQLNLLKCCSVFISFSSRFNSIVDLSVFDLMQKCQRGNKIVDFQFFYFLIFVFFFFFFF